LDLLASIVRILKSLLDQKRISEQLMMLRGVIQILIFWLFYRLKLSIGKRLKLSI